MRHSSIDDDSAIKRKPIFFQFFDWAVMESDFDLVHHKPLTVGLVSSLPALKLLFCGFLELNFVFEVSVDRAVLLFISVPQS